MAEKSPGAFRTIGELSRELGVAQHILRYWESRFPQLKPLQRAGNRRYYRPADVELARRIHRLLNEEGYTVRGVQKLLKDGNGDCDEPGGCGETTDPADERSVARFDIDRLVALRRRLASAIED